MPNILFISEMEQGLKQAGPYARDDGEHGFARKIGEEDEQVLKIESRIPEPHLKSEGAGAYQHSAGILAPPFIGIVNIRV